MQNQVSDMAVFGLLVAFLGFIARIVRDMAMSLRNTSGNEPGDTLPGKLMSAAYVPRDELKRIADKYGWWAPGWLSLSARITMWPAWREARRLIEARTARLE